MASTEFFQERSWHCEVAAEVRAGRLAREAPVPRDLTAMLNPQWKGPERFLSPAPMPLLRPALVPYAPFIPF